MFVCGMGGRGTHLLLHMCEVSGRVENVQVRMFVCGRGGTHLLLHMCEVLGGEENLSQIHMFVCGRGGGGKSLLKTNEKYFRIATGINFIFECRKAYIR